MSKKISNNNVWSGILFGIGLVAFLDEVVFHQLLHWHHFYDKQTTNIGLISDGLFHAFSWFATVAGLFWLSKLRREERYDLVTWVSGVLVGAGVFQLYDGTVQHKLMRIHQIRYVDHVLLYDIIWNLIALVLVITGVVLFRRRERQGNMEGITKG